MKTCKRALSSFVPRVAGTMLIVLVTSVIAVGQTATETSSIIVTQGYATLKRGPDRAWVSIAVESRDGKAAEARNQAAMQMTAVQTAIKATGITADAIKTTGFSMQPRTEWDGGRTRVKEYAVRNQIDVRVDNLDLLGDVLDAAGSIKGTSTLSVSITGLRFDLKDREGADQEALRMAVKDAMRRAEAMAAGAGRSLGAIIRIEEQRIAEPLKPVPMISVRDSRLMDAANGSAALNLSFPPGAAGSGNRGAAGGGGGGGGGGSPIETPIDPTEIEIRTLVTLTVAIR